MAASCEEGRGLTGGGGGADPCYYLGRDGRGENHPNMLQVRLGFIRKVYLILLSQLAITTSTIALFIYCPPVKAWVRGQSGGGQGSTDHVRYLLIASGALTLVVLCAIFCCEKPRRVYPWNYIFLFAFTIPESFLIGVLSASYNTQVRRLTTYATNLCRPVTL